MPLASRLAAGGASGPPSQPPYPGAQAQQSMYPAPLQPGRPQSMQSPAPGGYPGQSAYQQPPQQYGTPQQQYGTPQQQYARPAPPPPGQSTGPYPGSPAPGYGQPQQPFSPQPYNSQPYGQAPPGGYGGYVRSHMRFLYFMRDGLSMRAD